ncbi:MAG: hypothetical protein Q7S96_04055 [bacterium]|nr:hypothetical protein [bacterium]
MRIPETTINEFHEIWWREFGEDLDVEAAHDYAERVLSLMLAVYRPMNRDPP